MTATLRIVVADDEPDIREYFQKILSRLGHDVVGTAEDGEELLDLCRIHKPDLVVTDLQMPGLDGCEASKRIWDERPTPIILISAYIDPQLLSCANSGHIMGYLVKPIKRGDLTEAMVTAMSRFEQTCTSMTECAESDESNEDESPP